MNLKIIQACKIHLCKKVRHLIHNVEDEESQIGPCFFDSDSCANGDKSEVLILGERVSAHFVLQRASYVICGTAKSFGFNCFHVAVRVEEHYENDVVFLVTLFTWLTKVITMDLLKAME